MKKILLFTAALLCATSMWAEEICGNWTLIGHKTMACDTTKYLEINYKSMDSTKWENANVEFNNDEHGFGYKITGSSPDNKKMGIFSAYQYDLSVPAFTRMRYSWTFKIGSHNQKHHSTVCLYYNAESTTDPQPDILGAYVDFTNHYTYGTRPFLLVGPFINTHQEETAGWYYSGEYTKEFDFDNRDKASSYDRKLVIMLTHVTASAGGKSGLQETGVIKSIEDFALVKTDYYKIVTFNANGGEGSMDKDTIENSCNLTANAFTREGYYFMGWATSSDGAVKYADGAVITATAESKGPDTLYAVWQQIITAKPTPILGMVYNGNGKYLINAGTAVGGTMLYSLDNETWSPNRPVGVYAGTYTVYYKVEGDAPHPDYTPENNTVTATIDKATPTYTTRPSAIANLQYSSGENQTLIKAGTPTTGTIKYKLGDGEWSTELPQAIDSGNYCVYYYIQATNDNYNDSEPENLIATIHPTESPDIPEHENYDASKISVLAVQEGVDTQQGQHSEKLFDGNRATKWCSIKYNTDAYSMRPKDIVVWRTEGFVKMVSYTLTTGNDTQTHPNRNWSSWTLYGGSFESDDDAAAALRTEEVWTIIDNQIQDTVLKAFNDSSFQFACNNPGWYKYYRLVIHDIRRDSTPQDNIQQMAELTMGVTTFTPPTYVTRPSAKAYLKYSGNAQPLINSGSVTDGGTILYKLGNGAWNENVPQATDSGNYYVYYKIKASASGLYPESEPDTLITTIYGNKTVPVHDNYPCGGITVLAKQEGVNTNGNQRADRLFNGDVTSSEYNKWCSVTTGIEKYEDRPKDIVVWKTVDTINMISYELRVGDDVQTYHNRNWYSWTIYGGSFESDDAARAALTTEKGWTIIDNQINDTVLKEVNDARYNFVCNNPGRYKYYRLVIHALHVTTPAATQGEPGTQQMAELTMGIEHIVPAYQTRPSAKANLQYSSGENQTLIEEGTPTTGTILYQLGDGKWSETLPQASEIGNYYVYYKIDGSEIAPDTLIATIYGDRTVPEHDDYSYSNISVLTWREGYSTHDSEKANHLFDNNISSKWCSVSGGIEKYEDRPKDIVVWKTASAIKMVSYQLQTAYDTGKYPNRNWYSWTIYGGEFESDDAARAAMLNEGAWKIIDNQIKDEVLQEINDAPYDFACNNPDTYQYYRLVIHALHVTTPTANQGVQQMGELTMGIEKATPTGVEEANANGKAVKVLRDGQLFILREGKKYNAQGVLVESRK